MRKRKLTSRRTKELDTEFVQASKNGDLVLALDPGGKRLISYSMLKERVKLNNISTTQPLRDMILLPRARKARKGLINHWYSISRERVNATITHMGKANGAIANREFQNQAKCMGYYRGWFTLNGIKCSQQLGLVGAMQYYSVYSTKLFCGIKIMWNCIIQL